jgi:hypothetical protein
MKSIDLNLAETKSILDKESSIKKLRNEGVQEIERVDGGVLTTIFVSDTFLSQFVDFIEFQNHVEGK